MESTTIISTLCWIPKGYARSQPVEYEIRQEDIAEEERMMLDDEMPVFTQELGKLRDKQQKEKEGEMEEDRGGEEEEDGEYPEGFEDMSEEDRDDFKIKRTDGLLVCGKVENEFSSLEMYIYEKEKYNIYVHHEVQLSSFPLCLEFIGSGFKGEVNSRCNYMAVGTFNSEIEVWDMDTLNAIEPVLTLGQQQQANYTKKKKSKKDKVEDSHTDSVLCLSLNQFRQNILCSGSADHSIKLWDLQKGCSVFTYDAVHKDKVQQVKFNPQEEAVLLSAGFDMQLGLMDVRQKDSQMFHKLEAEVETVAWDHQDSNLLWFSLENGHVGQVDARKFSLDNLIYFQAANEQPISSVSTNKQVKGMIVTTSLDNQIRVWDVRDSTNVKLVDKLKPKAGKINCGAFYQDQPMLFAAGGEISEVVLWDLANNEKIKEQFKL